MMIETRCKFERYNAIEILWMNEWFYIVPSCVFTAPPQTYWITLAILRRAISNFPRETDAKPQRNGVAAAWRPRETGRVDKGPAPLTQIYCLVVATMVAVFHENAWYRTISFLPDSVCSFPRSDCRYRSTHVAQSHTERSRRVSRICSSSLWKQVE